MEARFSPLIPEKAGERKEQKARFKKAKKKESLRKKEVGTRRRALERNRKNRGESFSDRFRLGEE